LDISIDVIALYSDAPIDIVDLDTNNFVISNVSPNDEDVAISGAKFVSTFRSTESGKRFELSLRTVEGQYGTLEIFIVPKLTPKIAKVETFQIKPLALHERVHELPEDDNRLLSTLNVSGAFSVAEIHSWVSACLEGLPEKVLKDEVEYFFRSTFQGTVLYVKMKKGEAIFRSDNATTISVLDEIIAREANERKKRINTTYSISDETYTNVLAMMYPKVEYQLNLSDRIKLIEALKELQMQENDISFLAKDYIDVLDKERDLVEESIKQTQRLTFLYDVILKLYADKWKFKRQNGQKQIEQLKRILNSKEFDLKSLQLLFKN
jgi:Bardet-Biedl syndrome 7 protein